MSDRLTEYRQCQKRGHLAKRYITPGMGPTKGICHYCGVLFWEETVSHEENIPPEALVDTTQQEG